MFFDHIETAVQKYLCYKHVQNDFIILSHFTRFPVAIMFFDQKYYDFYDGGILGCTMVVLGCTMVVLCLYWLYWVVQWWY